VIENVRDHSNYFHSVNGMATEYTVS